MSDRETINDIINEYHNHHPDSDKSFEERFSKLEEFHNPDNIQRQQISRHAEYVVMGKPGDEDVSGAYTEAHKVIDSNIENDEDEVDKDTLEDAVESYLDEFLRQTLGSEQFKDIESSIREHENIDESDVRKYKSELASQNGLIDRNNEGEPKPYDVEQLADRLSGNKKIDVIDKFRDMARETQQMYELTLNQQVVGKLFDLKDRPKLAKRVKDEAESEGYEMEHNPLVKGENELIEDYTLLQQGAEDELRRKGYKPLDEE